MLAELPLHSQNIAAETGPGRLVMVSNQAVTPGQPQAGGVTTLLRAVLASRGGVWFGCSERAVASPAERRLRSSRYGSVQILQLDLTRAEHRGHYLGFANSVLWPLLHGQPERVRFCPGQYRCHRRVNQLMARWLAPLLQPTDRVWVHDYHLIPLAAELRALGVTARIGFFLHVPVPPVPLLQSLPCHAELFSALAACDLVGVQQPEHAQRLRQMLAGLPGAHAADGRVRHGSRVDSFPVGLDATAFARLAAAPTVPSLEPGRGPWLLGVDRLDYTKGLPQRLHAFHRFLHREPQHAGQVSLLQIAPPSRLELPEYQHLRGRLQRLAGRINRRHARPSWRPVHWLERALAREALAGLYRRARVGLVTSLQDGMNLVAKEYVAAQAPQDPGVLVLSRTAGAAAELDAALLVDPSDPDAQARAMARALTMPLDERRARWQSMHASLQRNDVSAWCDAFLGALQRS